MRLSGNTRSLADLFDAVLNTEPDLPALIVGGQPTTFGDWWAMSSVAAGGLAEAGARAGEVILLLLPSGTDFAICYLAALCSGAVVSAINPRLGPAEIAHIVGRARPSLIVTDTPERIPAPACCPVRTPRALYDAAGPVAPRWAGVRADAPAVVVWTTGSTGKPKGAWFDHESLAFIAAHMGPLSEPYDRKLMPVPFAHAAFMTRVYDQLLFRSTLVLTPSEWSAEAMLDTLVEQRITVGQGVPTQWEKLVELDRLPDADLSRLRLVSTGASRVPAALVTRLTTRLRCPVVVRYASTEVPLAFGTAIDDPPHIVAATVGRALGGAASQIRDDTGAALAAGAVGRVALRSPAQMRGYWRDPERTADAIGPDGWLTTSDLGFLDPDGNLTIVGRADDAYIRGGYNVYPAEVEAALSEHPSVTRTAVVGTRAPIIGEIGVAFVVADPRADPVTEADLRRWCRGRIADYKTPDHIVFVDDLPVNATFKVDSARLRVLAAAAAADGIRSRAARRVHSIDRPTTRQEGTAMAVSSHTLVEDRDGVRTVTFNRPEKLNAINAAMTATLWEALDALRTRDDLRVLVIQATGPYFTAGFDISEFGEPGRSPSQYRDHYLTHHRLYDAMEELDKPIILAAQGKCLGAGVEMSGSCDFRFASDDAEFQLPEIKLAVIPGSGGTSRMTRLLGQHWTKWLAMAARPVDAQRALTIGLVHEVYPAAELHQRVHEFAVGLTGLPREALGLAKIAINMCANTDPSTARDVERLANNVLVYGEEHRRRVADFHSRGKSGR